MNINDLVNKEFFVEIGEEGTISKVGISSIRDILSICLLPYNMPTNDWCLIRDNKKFVTRYKEYINRYNREWSTKYDPSKEVLATIGQLAKKYATSKDKIKIKVVELPNPEVHTGMIFGHPGGSCWFKPNCKPKGYGTQLEKFETFKGKAFLFYNQAGEGIARLWALPVDQESFVVFNGYIDGGKNTKKLMDLILQIPSLNLVSTQLTLGSYNSGLYVNNDAEFLVGSNKIVERVNSVNKYKSCGCCKQCPLYLSETIEVKWWNE
jgi:hypothetical protein